jgi:hypothetical protein
MADVDVGKNAAPDTDVFLELLGAELDRREQDSARTALASEIYELFQELNAAPDEQRRSELEQRLETLQRAHGNRQE